MRRPFSWVMNKTWLGILLGCSPVTHGLTPIVSFSFFALIAAEFFPFSSPTPAIKISPLLCTMVRKHSLAARASVKSLIIISFFWRDQLHLFTNRICHQLFLTYLTMPVTCETSHFTLSLSLILTILYLARTVFSFF